MFYNHSGSIATSLYILQRDYKGELGLLGNDLKLNLGDIAGKNMEAHNFISGRDGREAIIMIHDISLGKTSHVVRLYALKKEKGELVIDGQIDSFSFRSYEAAVEFANELPEMPAFELLMLFKQKQIEAFAGVNAKLSTVL